MSKSVIIIFVSLFIAGGSAFSQIPNSAYIVNTLGENLSRINIDDQNVTADAATLGLFTNQVVVHGDRAYVVNSGANEIQVIELATMNTTQNIPTGQGTNPWAIEFVNDSLAAISLLFTNQVLFVNMNTEETVETITVGSGPEGMKYHDGRLYVANSGFVYPAFEPGTVSVIRMDDFTVSTITVGTNPQALALDSQGNIIVACSGNFADISGEVDVIDTSADTLLHAESLNSTITFVAVDGNDQAYLSTFGAGVLVYDIPGRSLILDENNSLPGGPGLAIDSEDNVYVGDFNTDTISVYSSSQVLLNAYLVGDGPISISLFENTPTAISPLGNTIPEAITLYQNYPNPFNPETTLRFDIQEAGEVSLSIFNTLGEKVAAPVNEFLPAGAYEIKWNATDYNGHKLPSGVYFYQLEADNASTVKKMSLIR